tara:strand:- start:312 stop:644 length:333 start_codon:yes stop_codon:yes gene_type:complete
MELNKTSLVDLYNNVSISESTKEYIGDFKPTTDADFKWMAKTLKSLLADIEKSVKNGEDLSEIYPSNKQEAFESALMDLMDVKRQALIEQMGKLSAFVDKCNSSHKQLMN